MPPPPKIWTVQDLTHWCTAFFRDRGLLDSPRLDAELLLARVLNLKRIDLYLQFDRPLNPNELAAFKELVKRRVSREPVAHILGEKEFYGRPFSVSPHVLIPRPETEGLIDEVKTWCAKHRPQSECLQCLEVGTGSGCVAITLALELPTLMMMATDVSSEALAVAQQNAEKWGVLERIKFESSDIMQMAPPGRWDIMVSNPPYIESAEIVRLMPEVQKEPRLALDGGTDGLRFYRRLAALARTSLVDSGLLAVEIGEGQGAAAQKIFQEAGLIDIKIKKDLAGRDRIVTATNTHA